MLLLMVKAVNGEFIKSKSLLRSCVHMPRSKNETESKEVSKWRMIRHSDFVFTFISTCIPSS